MATNSPTTNHTHSALPEAFDNEIVGIRKQLLDFIVKTESSPVSAPRKGSGSVQMHIDSPVVRNATPRPIAKKGLAAAPSLGYLSRVTAGSSPQKGRGEIATPTSGGVGVSGRTQTGRRGRAGTGPTEHSRQEQEQEDKQRSRNFTRMGISQRKMQHQATIAGCSLASVSVSASVSGKSPTSPKEAQPSNVTQPARTNGRRDCSHSFMQQQSERELRRARQRVALEGLQKLGVELKNKLRYPLHLPIHFPESTQGSSPTRSPASLPSPSPVMGPPCIPFLPQAAAQGHNLEARIHSFSSLEVNALASPSSSSSSSPEAEQKRRPPAPFFFATSLETRLGVTGCPLYCPATENKVERGKSRYRLECGLVGPGQGQGQGQGQCAKLLIPAGGLGPGQAQHLMLALNAIEELVNEETKETRKKHGASPTSGKKKKRERRKTTAGTSDHIEAFVQQLQELATCRVHKFA